MDTNKTGSSSGQRMEQRANPGQQVRRQPIQGQRPVVQPASRQPVQGQRPVGQPARRQPVQGQRPVGQPAGRQPVQGQRPAGQPAGRQPAQGQRPVAQPGQGQRPSGQQVNRQPVQGQRTNGQPARRQPLPADPKARAELLKKRREMRKKRQELRISTISMLVLVPLFCLLTLYMLVLPRSKVSEIENRNLATFPEFTLSTYFSGDYTAGIAQWYDDTVPFRDSLKNASYKVQSLFGIATEDTITLVNMNAEDLVGAAKPEDGEGAEASSTADTATDSTIEAGAEEEEATEPQKDYTAEEAENDVSNGMLIVKQDGHWRCLVLYGGGSGDAYATALNYLRGQVDSSVSIYSMPAPLAAQFYLPSNAVAYSNDQSESMANVASKLAAGIKTIDLIPILAQHTEEKIYTRTDHHWASLGAFYAAEAFAEEAGVPFADISEYDVDVAEGYVGTLYSYSQDSRLKDDPEEFITYVPTCEYTTDYYDQTFDFSYSGDLILNHGTYLNYMGTDDVICKITTKVGNGRKLLIVKDSYGNAEIPCYTSSFDEIYVTDMRYLKCNLINMINDLGITDVLFTMCTMSVVGGNADNLMNLMTQNADVHLTDNGPNVTPEEPADDDAAAADETAGAATAAAKPADSLYRAVLAALPMQYSPAGGNK